jgi:hypothetical protein
MAGTTRFRLAPLLVGLATVLVLAALVGSAGAAAPGALMPRVVVAVPAPVDPGASASGSYVAIGGRTATYELEESVCSGCRPKWLELRYDGVSQQILRTTSNVIMSSRSSEGVTAWQEFEPDGEIVQYAATANGAATRLGDHASLGDYELSGSDVVWSSIDYDTFTFRLHLNGRDIARGLDPVGGALVGGNTIAFGVRSTSSSLVVYRRDTGRYSTVPLPPGPQEVASLVISEDGDRLVALRRGADGPFDPGSVWIYDVTSHETRTFALPGWPIYAVPTDGGRYLAWLMSVEGSGPHLAITDLQAGTTEDVSVTEPADIGEYTGNVSEGLLSWEHYLGAVGVYDMAARTSTVVAETGGGTEVANSGGNVAWLGPAYTGTATLMVSYPADEAVLAIAEALLRYGLPLAAEVRLGAPLALAVIQLRRGAYTSARTALQDFSGAVARLQASGTLDRQRSADLTAAAQRVVAVL